MSTDDIDEFRNRLKAIANGEDVSDDGPKAFLNIYQIEECAYRTAQIADDTAAFFEKLFSE